MAFELFYLKKIRRELPCRKLCTWKEFWKKYKTTFLDEKKAVSSVKAPRSRADMESIVPRMSNLLAIVSRFWLTSFNSRGNTLSFPPVRKQKLHSFCNKRQPSSHNNWRCLSFQSTSCQQCPHPFSVFPPYLCFLF